MNGGIVLGLAIHTAKRGPMVRCNGEGIEVTLEDGFKGDLRGKGGSHREKQVLALSMDQWTAVHTELNSSPFPPWFERRANICLQGIHFGPQHLGKQLRFKWNNVTLLITGEAKPCSRMDKVLRGLKDALTRDWRGGVTCRVVRGGFIQNHEPFEVMHIV